MIIKTVSVKGGVGKSIISAYLAKYLAESGKRVLVVDKDYLKFSSLLIKNSVKGVDVVTDDTTLDYGNIERNYDFIIVDTPTMQFESKFDKADEVVNLIVSDAFTLDLTVKYYKNLEGRKILIVNMVYPFPSDIYNISERIKDLDFDIKIVIPFIPKLFSSLVKEGKIKVNIDLLRTLAREILDKNFNKKLITPIM
ncbi:AAA family ATPase [Sulfolobus sp. E5-1-F]|uniref:AAA family ATPase n=1 Tax=Saccharolobus sp. E5-1-F TaxID=2663019 RepID=UPI0012958BC8|nr:AAA family ATPase [Sulfolobus sp. E5-1-F]QGA53919.1 AAA family ATPase [Sulfolobus sp. E5-1-F]